MHARSYDSPTSHQHSNTMTTNENPEVFSTANGKLSGDSGCKARDAGGHWLRTSLTLTKHRSKHQSIGSPHVLRERAPRPALRNSGLRYLRVLQRRHQQSRAKKLAPARALSFAAAPYPACIATRRWPSGNRFCGVGPLRRPHQSSIGSLKPTRPSPTRGPGLRGPGWSQRRLWTRQPIGEHLKFFWVQRRTIEFQLDELARCVFKNCFYPKLQICFCLKLQNCFYPKLQNCFCLKLQNCFYPKLQN